MGSTNVIPPPRTAGGLRVVGGLLVAAIVALGAAPLVMPDGYQWVRHGVSESGAQGIDGAWLARLGFVLFGLAVCALVALRHRDWGWVGSVAHGVFGLSMFGVAAFSTKPWASGAVYDVTEDLLHSVFATAMGFGFIGGVAAVAFTRRPRTRSLLLGDIGALAVASTVPLLMSVGVWGLLQRAMFLAAAIWYGREARTAAG